MIPSSWLALIIFALFVAPGLVYDLLGTRRKVEQAESAFREVSRVVLSSMFFTGIGVLAISIVRIMWPHWVIDPGRLLDNPSEYVKIHYGIILRTFVMEELIALSAVALHFLLTIGKPVLNISAWQECLANSEDKDHFAFAKIRLMSGEEKEGHVVWNSISLARKDREIILQPDMDEEAYVILAADSIESIDISWSRIRKERSRVSYINRVLDRVRE